MAQRYYSPVTVNTGQVPSTQTNFPMLISYTDARFKDLAHGGHVNRSDGFDIRPYSDSGLTSALSYELERYNATTGEIVMWVKQASLSNGSVIYLGYGDSSLITNDSSATTWSNGFISVYHLKDGTTLSVDDSLNAMNCVNQGATAGVGQIDGGGAFASASNQYIQGPSFSPAIAITMSAWVNGTTFPNDYNGVFTHGAGGLDSNAFFVKSNGKIYCKISALTGIAYDGNGSHTLSIGTWYFLAFTYDSSTSLIGYVNASVDSPILAANGNLSGSTIAFDIGRQRSTSSRYFNGVIDEVRLCNVARSADWITTEYNNQVSPSTFATLGSETTLRSLTTSHYAESPFSF